MSEDKIEKEMLKALGNLKIEGIDISKGEYQTIARVLKKYQDELGEDAIQSLLYALCIGKELEEDDNDKRK